MDLLTIADLIYDFSLHSAGLYGCIVIVFLV